MKEMPSNLLEKGSKGLNNQEHENQLNNQSVDLREFLGHINQIAIETCEIK